jgi:hypothetical protein
MSFSSIRLRSKFGATNSMRDSVAALAVRITISVLPKGVMRHAELGSRKSVACRQCVYNISLGVKSKLKKTICELLQPMHR